MCVFLARVGCGLFCEVGLLLMKGKRGGFAHEWYTGGCFFGTDITVIIISSCSSKQQVNRSVCTRVLGGNSNNGLALGLLGR